MSYDSNPGSSYGWEGEQGNASRYELTEEELRALTAELIAAHPLEVPASEQRHVCYRVDSGSRFANIGRHIEREVFEEKFGNDASEMEQEYSAYDKAGVASFFITVDRQTQDPTGVLRMIQNSSAGFKTLNDLADPKKTSTVVMPEDIYRYHGIEDLDTCWDAATLAVRKEYRGMNKYVGIMRYLTRSAYLYGMENDFHHVFMIMDKRVKEQSTQYLGIPYKPLASLGKLSYLGSEESYPMYCYYPEFLDKMKGIRMMTPRRLMARKAVQQLLDDSEDQFLRVGD